MKNVIILILIPLLVFSLSCNKEEIELDEYWGEASATKNGSDWMPLPHAGISNINGKLFVSCNTYSGEGYHRELLHLFKIPLIEGNYKIERTEVRDEDDIV